MQPFPLPLTPLRVSVYSDPGIYFVNAVNAIRCEKEQTKGVKPWIDNHVSPFPSNLLIKEGCAY